MKKIYSHLIIVFCSVGCLYFVGLVIMPEGSLLDRSLATIAYPMVCVKKKLVDGYEAVVQFVDIQKKSEAMCNESRKKYEDLQARYIELVGLSAQWQDSQELMQFKRRYKDQHALVVDIIAKQFSASEHCYLIEGGSNKGIKPDMVAVYKNCLVGRVSQVYERYSKVMLITDPHCKVAALCRTSLDRGIHEGTGSLNETRLSYVFDTQMDLEKRLQKGDFVISSGEGLVFPKGFGLGTIVDYKKNDLRVNIILKPLLDLKQLNYCCIIAKGAELNETDFAGAPLPKQESPVDILIKKQEIAQTAALKQAHDVENKTAAEIRIVEAVPAATTHIFDAQKSLQENTAEHPKIIDDNDKSVAQAGALAPLVDDQNSHNTGLTQQELHAQE